MMFLNPGGAWLLLFIILFAWLIRLSLRFRRQSVPSLFLLADEIDSLPVLTSTFLRRRRFRFFLLLAAVTLIASSALMPVLGDRSEPADAVIIVDHRTRRIDAEGVERGWEPVLTEFRRILDSLGGRDRVMVVISDRGPVTNGFVSPRKALRALRNASPSDLPAEGEANRTLVETLQSLEPDLGFIVSPLPSAWRPLTSRSSLSWHILPVRIPSAAVNLSLLNVDVQPDLLRQGIYSLFCRFAAYSSRATDPVPAGLTVRLDGKTVTTRKFLLAPGEDSILVLEDIPLAAGLLTVELSPHDAFMQDNVFRRPLGSRPLRSVKLFTTGNEALESALKAVGGISVQTLPADTMDDPVEAPLSVFDGPVPDDIRGSALFFSPFSMPAGIVQRGESSYSSRIDFDGNDPLLEGVTFAGLRPGRIPVIVPPPSMRVLARADGNPLVVAGRLASGHRMALVTFDPVATGWIYEPDFPILVANLISWLSLDTPATGSSFVVGDVADGSLFGADGLLTDPAGSGTRLGGNDSGTYMFTQAGVYSYRGSDAEGSIFVNLLDEGSSRLVAAGEAHGGDGGDGGGASFPGRPYSRPLGKLLLFTGLLLLVVEPLAAPRDSVGRLA